MIRSFTRYGRVLAPSSALCHGVKKKPYFPPPSIFRGQGGVPLASHEMFPTPSADFRESPPDQRQHLISRNTSSADRFCASLVELADMISRDPAVAERMKNQVRAQLQQEIVCAVSTLQRSQQAEAATYRVPQSTLQLIAFRSSIPFVCFGFVDNAVLILAGDAIDLTLGMKFGISTMAAAALGNIVSNVVGLGLGGVIEDVTENLNIPKPKLSYYQSHLRSVRVAHYTGLSLGTIAGCVIGMAPLLFIG